MLAIDIHGHFLPELLISRLKENKETFHFVQVEDIPEGTFRFKLGDGEWTRPVHPDLMNLENRKKVLAKNEIDMQINACWLDIFGYNLTPKQGAEWSRFINKVLIEEFEDENMFVPLATVPLQDGDLAAEELENAAKEGHAGVMIGSWIERGQGEPPIDLDDPSLYPFWEKASDLQMPVFLHPVFAGQDSRTKPLGMVNTVARPNETTVALTKILYSGIPHKYPELKIIISHGGGSLPFILGRLQRNYDLLASEGLEIFNPTEGFKKLYFDSVVFEPEALRFLLSLVDEEKIMLGSDDPFPIRDPKPRAVIESEKLGLSKSTKKAFLSGNALKLFNLEIK